MIEDTTSLYANEAAVEKKSIKRRAIVAVLLAAAALGARSLHQRGLPAAPCESQASIIPAHEDEASANVSGANSLLGDISTDRQFDTPTSVAMSSNELDMTSVKEQAGTALADNELPYRLDPQFAKALNQSQGVVPSAQLSAIPEPGTAGVLLVLAAPAVGLKRSRRRSEIQRRSNLI